MHGHGCVSEGGYTVCVAMRVFTLGCGYVCAWVCVCLSLFFSMRQTHTLHPTHSTEVILVALISFNSI